MKKMAMSMLVFILLCAVSLTACSSPAKETGGAAGTQDAKAENKGPVDINLGIGFASEENLWFMQYADASVVPNKGKSYNLKMTQFRANADRLNAYQAGQINGGTIGQTSAMFAAAQGVPLKAVSIVAKDTPGQGFNTPFLVLKSSGIKTVADLKGKTIGIPDFKSPTDMWARAAVRSAGLDPDKDVKWAVVPFPATLESVKSNKIATGAFQEPFRTNAMNSGEFEQLFTSKTGVPFDEEFFVLFMNPDFMKKNEQAVKDFLADYINATKYFKSHPKEVKQVLLDKKFVQSDPSVYLNTVDNNRSDDGKLHKENWEKTMEILIKEKWLDKPVDLDALLDNSYLPK